MEAPYVPAAAEPPRVRNRKPKPRNPGDQGLQAVHGQQPPNRRSNRAPQPAGAETYDYAEPGYDPNHDYAEAGYNPKYVDAHGNAYGGAHLNAANVPHYGNGYAAGAPANAAYNYDEQGNYYDAAGQEYGQYGHVSPYHHGQGIPKKSLKPRPVAGAEVQGNYAIPGAYNAVDPSLQKPSKGESKPRRTKPQEMRLQDNGEVPEPGSARSRTSQEGSGSNRSQRQDGIARDQESVHSGRSGSARSGGRSMTRPTEATGNNALNEHVRKAGGGRPAVVQDVSMAVFDPCDRTEARPTLDEWMKKQGNHPVQQDESLIVFDDRDKKDLETRMFGAPLPKPNKPPPKKMAPLQEEEQQQERPQYQPRVGGAAPTAFVSVVEEPLYRPGERRGRPSPVPQGGANPAYNKPRYNNDDVDNMEIQAVQPNPTCMACVHGVGVPIARLATRIACKHACLCCTIL